MDNNSTETEKVQPKYKPRLKLIWEVRDTHKKTYAPIKYEFWTNIPFFKAMVDEGMEFENEEDFPVELMGTFYTPIVRFYLSWCCNIDLAYGLLNALVSFPSHEVYNLIELCNYLGDETKLAVIPTPFPSNNTETVEAIKNLTPIWQKKIMKKYLKICSLMCKEWRVFDTPYRLWVFLGYKPLVAEYFFSKSAEAFYVDCRISNKDASKYKGKIYADLVRFLISTDEFVCHVYDTNNLYSLDFTTDKISGDAYQAASDREQARTRLRTLSGAYKNAQFQLQQVKQAIAKPHVDGIEYDEVFKNTKTEVEELKKSYEDYKKQVSESNLLSKNELKYL